jgi:polyisoprenoid-binding protein YceI
VRYGVAAGTVTVQARSRIHDTTTVWNKVSGEIVADPDTLATAGATAQFDVDMTSFDAGDFLRNRKLRKDLDVAAHPTARFELRRVHSVVRDGASFTATGEGVLAWRGRKVDLVLTGRGTLDGMTASAHATFDLDIRNLGVSAPRFLMFKMDDEVTVAVAIRAPVVPPVVP